MKKLGFLLLFFTFFQLICVIIAAQYYWVYNLVNGGFIGGVLSNIHWLIWVALAIEFIISITVIIIENRNEEERKDEV